MYPDETPTSYVSRLTRYCAVRDPRDLCLDFGFRWRDFVRGDDMLFERLASITGVPFGDLVRWAIKTVGHNRFEVAGEAGNRNSMLRARIRLCPRCVIEDREHDGSLGPHRRPFWQFQSIRACERHHTPLITLAPERYTIANYDFLGQVEKHWETIEATSKQGEELRPTPLEGYLVKRLHGHRQETFLDSLPLHLATRLCEVLGFVLAFGSERPISDADTGEMSEAGGIGFQALRGGEESLYQALDGLVSPIATRTVRHQSDFGAFFEWLRNAKIGPEFEDLKDNVRRYIFRTYPFRRGDMVLGQTCKEPSGFTIEGACRELQMERVRMTRFLIGTGAATDDGPDGEIWLRKVLDRSDVAALRAEMKNRMTYGGAAVHLGVSIGLLEALRHAGLLSPTLDALDQRPKYRRRDLEDFVADLGAAPRATSSCDDLSPLTEAAIRVRCAAIDIIRLILRDELECYQLEAGRGSLGRVAVSVPALKLMLPPLEMAAMSKGDASRRLRVAYPTINALVEAGSLEVIRSRNPKSRQFIDAITFESLYRFEERYVSLGQLSRFNRRASGPFKVYLEARDICPEDDTPGVSCYYARRPLVRPFARLGLSVPPPKGAIS
ncbi:TniQ family protein [Jannaschia marina]|uniref:TniQ family protein n=1 Tax=Jannaschia marina TaxID=2741674 RepID=UPI0015CA2E50|nr:TniQ family protein [Jannaschia marina]